MTGDHELDALAVEAKRNKRNGVELTDEQADALRAYNAAAARKSRARRARR